MTTLRDAWSVVLLSLHMVYTATIVAHHEAVDDSSLGKHYPIIRFCGEIDSSQDTPHHLMDLSMLLLGLQRDSFEPLDSVELK